MVVGSISLDMVARSPRIPGPGQNVCDAEFQMVPGGKGANQAVAARRLGSDTMILGCVGTDLFGDFLLDRLSSEEVDNSLVVRTAQKHTGVALIVVEEDTGTNTIVVAPGANMELSTSDLDSLEPFYGRVHSCLFQFETTSEVVAEGARRAREAGVTTILDAGPPRSVGADLLRNFDIVSPNQDELGALTGRDASDIARAGDAARALLREGVRAVVVKMGKAGAFLATGDGSLHFQAHAVRALDATAAGDAFTAGLAVALGEGRALPDAVRFANAAGALAVTVFGAQPSMPGRDAVDRLLDSQRVTCSKL
jgi:ribokinase